VMVHLPIGILLIALLLQWLSRKDKYRSVKDAVPVVLLCGCIAAFISCISGYLLSISDDYDTALVSWHMWMGLAVMFVSFLLYAKERNASFGVNKTLLSSALLILVFVTGHLGGSLTHGSDYFTKPLKNIFSKDSTSAAAIKPIANVQEALAYSDVIKPILETKCYSCHNANKQKGGLRMDDSLLLMKGGKDGKVIETGNADASEMIKRLLLPVDNEDHMPPKEKPQPTEQQIALLHWWIQNNNDFTKRVKEINQPEKIKPVLLSLQKTAEIKKESNDLPLAEVEKADDKITAQLKQKGIIVLPVKQNSNYLLVNFVTHPAVDKDDLQLLLQLKKQIVWLKLDNSSIHDSAMPVLAKLTSLTRLYLSHTAVTDKGLAQLQPLANLAYLNLVGTKITLQGLLPLKNLKKLQSLYLYQTAISKQDWASLKNEFPKTQIDSGGYQVPLFNTDTTLVKGNAKY
jgi:mono/diheme cytochrome c family protein